MTLHPHAEKFLERLQAIGAPAYHTLGPTMARAAMASGYALMAAQLTPVNVSKVDNQTVVTAKRDTPIRIYWPELPGLARPQPPFADAPERLFPLVVFIHGGGFVLGDLDQYDDMCRRLCQASSSIIVSIGYGLAPESKFPDPVEECYTVVNWAVRHALELGADKTRIAISGDSAGGNLAAAVTLLARDRGGPKLTYQVLMYPTVDLYGQTESKVKNGTGYFLEAEDMFWFRSCYLPDERDARDPLASPLLAPDHTNLPPALVITAEFDPLHDEGEAYAGTLREAGVPVEHRNYAGMIHGFMSMTWMFEDGREAIELAGARLREAFDGAAAAGD
ncbi:alpha/beta hydrolase [Alicyclobacillus mengziensis]|uniref:Alpha/beta hydrolase n=1 Tax=Alicyclobacillus mengziensis TaxID=2931921 RepID=A0A9X7W0T5_9BACL|nr:alpha/beta hydrolase [Alicyclobacillus mengziensis]QSO48105.1 alpha/beta hydrolase [Alicyclobacillus mengziensis]